MVDEPDLLTINDLVERLQLSRSSVYKLVNEGMPSIMIGKNRRFRINYVLDWLENRDIKHVEKPPKLGKIQELDIVLLQRIAAHVKDTGVYLETQEEASEHIGGSPRTISDRLKRLKGHGYIKQEGKSYLLDKAYNEIFPKKREDQP